jgi:tryptophan synthase beta chain
MERYRFLLDDQEMPRQWYNIAADLPPHHRRRWDLMVTPHSRTVGTGLPMNLIEQEVSTQRWIDIPQEVLDIYALWRPAPLYRAIAPRTGIADSCKNLLQIRRCQSGRQP